MLLPPPDISANYVDEKSGRPSKDFFNWIKSLDRNVRGISGLYFNVKDAPYNAKGDGVVDDTTAIIAARDAAIAAGGGTVYFPPGTYPISASIVVNNSNLAFIGAGADGSHDGGSGSIPATKIKWVGAAGGQMFAIFTVKSAANSVIGNIEVRNIALDGNNLADYGLNIISVRNCTFDHIYIFNVEFVAVYIGAWITGTDTAEAADTQGCIFRNVKWRLFESTSTTVTGMILDGSSNANTSINKFELCTGQGRDGPAWELLNCDNNTFYQCSGFLTGTGKTFLLRGKTIATNKSADDNVFFECGWAPGGCVVQGTDSGFDVGTVNNCFYAIDNGNGSDFPTVGVGSRVLAIMHDGRTKGMIDAPVTVAALPGTPAQGLRAMVNNATAVVFNSIVAGGGGNTVPVYYDGANWRIG